MVRAVMLTSIGSFLVAILIVKSAPFLRVVVLFCFVLSGSMKKIYLVCFRNDGESSSDGHPLNAFTTLKKANAYIDALNKLSSCVGVVNYVLETNLY